MVEAFSVVLIFHQHRVWVISDLIPTGLRRSYISQHMLTSRVMSVNPSAACISDLLKPTVLRRHRYISPTVSTDGTHPVIWHTCHSSLSGTTICYSHFKCNLCHITYGTCPCTCHTWHPSLSDITIRHFTLPTCIVILPPAPPFSPSVFRKHDIILGRKIRAVYTWWIASDNAKNFWANNPVSSITTVIRSTAYP